MAVRLFLALFASFHSLELPPATILPVETDNGDACRARLGLVILSVDETLESEFRRYFPYQAGTVMYHTRMDKGPEIDVHDLNATRDLIPAAAALLPRFPFDAVGFACTSDAAVLGEAELSELVAKGAEVPSTAVTNPLTAAKRALLALNATRVGMLTPYTEDITSTMADLFEEDGMRISAIRIFNQTDDSTVARITPDSVLAGLEAVAAADPTLDAIFVSCTQTRTVDVIRTAEKRIGKPVVSSNSAMAWDLLRLAGLLTETRRQQLSSFGGRLFSVPVASHPAPRDCGDDATALV
jgi:maleate isomerase